ncbi:class I SAM-dependent methyltransferase [Microbacterium hydrocarbonoxydans]|uniref:Methyltransferase domain-containing protein n=1 Tax=Microbacterium hydrocarbonoxydans TaxID=273678 RepID=A0A1H4MU46_9MICO|nr:class I SAM-dependent methyltransferase [Microbacterium hydrocarbonoxydans]SEB85892.1 Methyltransferase domain-containing protein [Microbacterium hydrocarbonoxydans]
MKDWAGTGRAYADSYASLCVGTADALRDALGAPADRTLLDVGSGTGLLTAALAQDGWETSGCEPEPTMREIAQREHPLIPVHDGSLPSLPFAAGAFDAVVANFVLNHVSDPRGAARELLRVSRERVAATIWTDSPSWLWREVSERAGVAPATGERLPPERDFERSVEGFGRMLADGGWPRPQVVEVTWTWHARPVELWASAEGGVGAAGQTFRSLGDSDRSSFRAAFDLVCAERSTDGRLPLQHSAAVAVAQVYQVGSGTSLRST